MIDDSRFTDLLKDQIKQAVDSAVQHHVNELIQAFVLDPEWMAKIETLVTQNFLQKFNGLVGEFDLDSAVAANIDTAIERWHQRMSIDFRTRGIHDRAEQTQIEVMDDVTVINNTMAVPAMVVADDAEVQGTVTVKDLVVRNTVNVDAPAWQQLKDTVRDQALQSMTDQWREQLVSDVLDRARESGIDFNSIHLNGFPLVMGNRLNPDVTVTNIQHTGTLDELKVSGSVDLNDTVSVRRGRLGINTQDPEMPLTIWDQEVVLIAGRHEKNTAYLGTSKKQTLHIGINRSPVLTLQDDGLVVLKELRLDRWRIGHTNTVPNWQGTRGDIYFNHDPKPDAAFAWVCLGGTRWQSLKAIAT